MRLELTYTDLILISVQDKFLVFEVPWNFELDLNFASSDLKHFWTQNTERALALAMAKSLSIFV